MKLQVGNYYLNTMGEIVKILRKANDKTDIYQYWDNDRSYTSDGVYDLSKQTDFDLLMEIPTDKLREFIKGLIND